MFIAREAEEDKKIITKTYLLTDRRTSCIISIDRPSGATLDNWKGGRKYIKEYNTSPGGPKRPPPEKEFYSKSKKK